MVKKVIQSQMAEQWPRSVVLQNLCASRLAHQDLGTMASNSPVGPAIVPRLRLPIFWSEVHSDLKNGGVRNVSHHAEEPCKGELHEPWLGMEFLYEPRLGTEFLYLT